MAAAGQTSASVVVATDGQVVIGHIRNSTFEPGNFMSDASKQIPAINNGGLVILQNPAVTGKHRGKSNTS